MKNFKNGFFKLKQSYLRDCLEITWTTLRTRFLASWRRKDQRNSQSYLAGFATISWPKRSSKIVQVISRQFLSQNLGFSLLEMLVCISISIMLLSFALTTYLNLISGIKKLDKNIDNEMDTGLLEMSLSKTLAASGPSFNVLLQVDDSDLPFFDYFWDVPDKKTISKLRSITLNYNSNIKEILLLVNDESRGLPMAYDPVFAYDSDDPASLETSSTLTYIGINGTSSKGACNSVVSNKNPHWKASGSFILSSPVPQRPANNAILVDHSQPTRNLTYIGKVTPDEKDLTNIALLNGKVYTKKPADPAVSILNPNNFFLNLPVVGGASPFVTLSPIKIVKLIAIPILVGTKTCIQLEEAVYIGDTLVKRTRNPAMIREIKFVRQSVALPLISVNIEECI